MVYLICFDTHFKHAKHYIGFTKDENFEARMEYHRKGSGSRLLRAVNKAGIPWKVTRTWPNADGNFERDLKNKKRSKNFCPICNKNIKDASNTNRIMATGDQASSS